jgi:hypothetical protein
METLGECYLMWGLDCDRRTRRRAWACAGGTQPPSRGRSRPAGGGAGAGFSKQRAAAFAIAMAIPRYGVAQDVYRGVAPGLGEKGVRLAQKMHVGPCITLGIQL